MTAPDLRRPDLCHWLALWRAPGIGPRRFRDLLDRVGDPRHLFDSPGQWVAWGLNERLTAYLRAPDWASVEADLRWLEGPKNHLLTLDSPLYPTRLREIADAPPVLFVHGDPAVLTLPQLAMVGSRNPTPPGRDTAHAFAAALAEAGLVITSGLAEGIDGACHQGALSANGLTIAVTGTGLDRVYPAMHRDLAHRIAERGALVSELPPGTPPRASHFPKRNRIISGLSLGVLVVEAAKNSGSLITARQASEQGREVFAIPGSIHNPMARGCHALIREGAKLIETAADILVELAPQLHSLLAQALPVGTNPAAATGTAVDPEHRQVLDAMGFDPVVVDEIMARSGLRAEAVCSILLLLELEGYVSSVPGGRYQATGKTSQEPP